MLARAARPPGSVSRAAGGRFLLVSSPDQDVLTSGGDITQCSELPTVEPYDLIGYKFVKEHDGTPQRATVKELSEDDGKFLIEFVNGGEELMNYADLINIFNKAYEDDDNDQLWTYEKILDHRKVSGNKWEVNVLWDTGDTTWEPMDIIKAADDKMTLAAYPQEKEKLIDTPGWKWARRLTNNPKKFIRMAKIFMTVAAGVIVLGHIPSKNNIADMLTKALGPIAHFPHMKAYLH